MSYENKNILLVDDEENILDVIKAYLEKDGYKVFTAKNGFKAIEIFNNNDIDFAILDLMLPDLPGEEVCKRIRLTSQVPILMLTAKVEESDRIYGLDIGADDYLSKPFSPNELVARVRAIFRRIGDCEIKSSILTFNDGDLTIDLGKLVVLKNSQAVDLTATEFKLLFILAQNPGRIFSRDELVTKILGYDYGGYDRTIDTHIKNIRHKIDDNNFKYISTVYGLGYKFAGDLNA